MRAFWKACACFPEGEIEQSENPDFLIYTSQGILGIEHTELFQEDGKRTQQAQESIEDRLLQLAEEEYNKIESTPVQVNWGFHQRFVLPNSERQIFAKKLAELVAFNITKHTERAFSLEQGEESLPEGVSHISFLRQDYKRKTNWFVLRAGWSRDDTVERIQAVIYKKNQRYKDYRKRCSKAWLLIVADGFNPSSFFEVNEDIENHTFLASFDKVFFLECSQSRNFELIIN